MKRQWKNRDFFFWKRVWLPESKNAVHNEKIVIFTNSQKNTTERSLIIVRMWTKLILRKPLIFCLDSLYLLAEIFFFLTHNHMKWRIKKKQLEIEFFYELHERFCLKKKYLEYSIWNQWKHVHLRSFHIARKFTSLKNVFLSGRWDPHPNRSFHWESVW